MGIAHLFLLLNLEIRPTFWVVGVREMMVVPGGAGAAPPPPPGQQPPGQQPQQCHARCSYIHDSFTAGCGVARARQRCSNLGTVQLTDPTTGQPMDAHNPHAQAQIRQLDLAQVPRQGPIMVCPAHAGLVARAHTWSTAGKAAGLAGAAAGAAALAYGAGKLYGAAAPAPAAAPDQELRDLLRQTLRDRRQRRLREIQDKLRQDGYTLTPRDKKLLIREGLMPRPQTKAAPPNESKQDALVRQIKAEQDVQDVRDYTAAYRKWSEMPSLQQQACLSGCPNITSEERRLLRQPPPSVARTQEQLLSPGWAWKGDDVPATWMEQATGALSSAWSAAGDVADWMQSLVPRMFNSVMDSMRGAQTIAQDLAWSAFYTPDQTKRDTRLDTAFKNYQDPRNELNLAMAQADRYVYSVSSIAYVEALTLADQKAQSDKKESWESIRGAIQDTLQALRTRVFTWFNRTRYYRETDYGKQLLKAIGPSSTGKASFDAAQGVQDVMIKIGLLDASGEYKMKNWTSRHGWLFDMQSNIVTRKFQWLPGDAMEPRVDASWRRTVGKLFDLPPNAGAAYVEHLRADLRDMRATLVVERDHSRAEAVAVENESKGLHGIQDPENGIPFAVCRQQLTKIYRDNQNARVQWIDHLLHYVDLFLQDTSGELLAQRQTRVGGFDASWQDRRARGLGAYQRG